jgi:hypothetical protein
MESYSPEVAEAKVVERFGLRIENLVTERVCDDMLSGICVTDSAERDRRNSDCE